MYWSLKVDAVGRGGRDHSGGCVFCRHISARLTLHLQNVEDFIPVHSDFELGRKCRHRLDVLFNYARSLFLDIFTASFGLARTHLATAVALTVAEHDSIVLGKKHPTVERLEARGSSLGSEISQEALFVDIEAHKPPLRTARRFSRARVWRRPAATHSYLAQTPAHSGASLSRANRAYNYLDKIPQILSL